MVTSSERWRSAAHATQRLESRCWRLEQAHAGRRCCCSRVVVRGEAERLRAPIVTSSERWISAAHATQRLEGRCWRLEQAHAVRRCCCTRVVVGDDARRLRAPIVTSSKRWSDGDRRRMPRSGLRAGAGISSKRTLAGGAVTRGLSSAMTRDDCAPRLSHRASDGDRRRMPRSGLRAGAGASSRRTLAGDAVARGLPSATKRDDRAPRLVTLGRR